MQQRSELVQSRHKPSRPPCIECGSQFHCAIHTWRQRWIAVLQSAAFIAAAFNVIGSYVKIAIQRALGLFRHVQKAFTYVLTACQRNVDHWHLDWLRQITFASASASIHKKLQLGLAHAWVGLHCLQYSLWYFVGRSISWKGVLDEGTSPALFELYLSTTILIFFFFIEPAHATARICCEGSNSSTAWTLVREAESASYSISVSSQ